MSITNTITMTKKTLLKNLIAHYTKAATEMMNGGWRDILFVRRIRSGVCDLAIDVFKQDSKIKQEAWINYWTAFNETGENDWTWIKLLGKCETIAEALANIETRIEIMCHELYSGVE